MIYLPPEIWRHIFEYDNTYKEIYNHLLCEMKTKTAKDICISSMKRIFESYHRYKHNYLFRRPYDEGIYEDYNMLFVIKRLDYYYNFRSLTLFI